MRTKKIYEVDEIKNRHFMSLYVKICDILATVYPDREFEFTQAAQMPYQMDGYPVSNMIRVYLTDYYGVFKNREDIVTQALHLIDGNYRLPLMPTEDNEPENDNGAADEGVGDSTEEP